MVGFEELATTADAEAAYRWFDSLAEAEELLTAMHEDHEELKSRLQTIMRAAIEGRRWLLQPETKPDGVEMLHVLDTIEKLAREATIQE